MSAPHSADNVALQHSQSHSPTRPSALAGTAASDSDLFRSSDIVVDQGLQRTKSAEMPTDETSSTSSSGSKSRLPTLPAFMKPKSPVLEKLSGLRVTSSTPPPPTLDTNASGPSRENSPGVISNKEKERSGFKLAPLKLKAPRSSKTLEEQWSKILE